MKIVDVLDFADFILYPPNLPTDVRIDIANRLLKYSRQKKSQIESTKKEKEVTGYVMEEGFVVVFVSLFWNFMVECLFLVLHVVMRKSKAFTQVVKIHT